VSVIAVPETGDHPYDDCKHHESYRRKSYIVWARGRIPWRI